MSTVIKFSLDRASMNRAVRELRDYEKWLRAKAIELSERLAARGAVIASIEYARAFYTGPKYVDITVEERGEGRYAIIASGETVLFLEFGAGVTYGDGHPQAEEFGYGPGTYPSDKGHWDDPHGWWLPKEAQGSGEDKSRHTYGNAPTMAMYNAGRDMRLELEAVAREVFSK